MEKKELLEQAKAARNAVSDFSDFVKKNYGEEIMFKDSLVSQMYHAAEDFYWELLGIEADLKMETNGARYYVDGVQISKSEAFRIKAQNEWLLEKAKATGDMSELADCKFVVEIK